MVVPNGIFCKQHTYFLIGCHKNLWNIMISCSGVLANKFLYTDRVYQKYYLPFFNIFSIPYKNFGQILGSLPFYQGYPFRFWHGGICPSPSIEGDFRGGISAWFATSFIDTENCANTYQKVSIRYIILIKDRWTE